MLIVDATKSFAERILFPSSNADLGILLLFCDINRNQEIHFRRSADDGVVQSIIGNLVQNLNADGP
jgi:hypothetical protein